MDNQCSDFQSQNDLLESSSCNEIQYGDDTSKVKGKRKSRKKTPSRRNKGSPVLKVDEETVNNEMKNSGESQQNANNMNSNDKAEDENLLVHLVLSKILNRKKMELLTCQELRSILSEGNKT